MKSKKVAIGAVILFLIIGTGTFVFAGQEQNKDGEGTFTNEDINYKKVDDKKGQEVPVIKDDSNNNDKPANEEESNSSNDDNLNEEQNTGSNTGSNISRPITKPGGSNSSKPGSSTNPGSSENTPSENNPGNGNNDESDKKEENKPDIPSKEPVPLNVELKYSNVSITNENVTITIIANKKIESINEGGWTIIDKVAKKSFSSNTDTTRTIVIKDYDGKSAELFYDIKNIDKTAPIVAINYSETGKNPNTILVTIESNEKINAINEKGWIYTSNNNIITKEFSEDCKGTLEVQDEAGNSAYIDYEVIIPNDEPIISTIKDENNTTITIISKEPIEGIDNCEKLDDGTYKTTIIIPNSDKNNVISSDGDVVEVLISNKIDGVAQKTNKPVTVTIVSNKELKELEGWILSDDKKSLTKIENKSKIEKIEIFYLDGTSSIIEYTILGVDTECPNILDISPVYNTNNTITIKINTTENVSIEYASTDNDYKWVYSSKFTRLFKKNFNIDKLEQGQTETLTFTDKYDNKSTFTYKFIYRDGEVIIEKQ